MEFLVEAFSVIFEKVFDCTISAVGRQIRYPIDYKSNLENLQRKVVEIEATKRTVEGKVVKATRNVEKIEDGVQMWLTDVKKIMAKVGKFFEDEGQAKMNCCNGQCPNLKARYQLSKRAYKLGLDVKEINDRGGFSENRGAQVFTSLHTWHQDVAILSTDLDLYRSCWKHAVLHVTN